MVFKVEILEPEGNKRAIHSLENIAANTHFGVERSLWKSGKDILSEFSRQVLAKDKKGTLYVLRDRSGRRRRHVSSAPGQTPANRTGNYRKSGDFNVSNGNQLVFGNAAEYSGFLELGTSRMKKRPGLSNTIKATERDVIRNLATGIVEKI